MMKRMRILPSRAGLAFKQRARLSSLARAIQSDRSFKLDGKLVSMLSPSEKQALLEQVPRPGSRVVVGMSGGVDSSVSAAILSELGCYDVTGCWMKNWDLQDEAPTKVAVCSQEKDWEDASQVAQMLDIPIVQKDFCKDYWCSVWEPCLREYSTGRTPNPDILCNREIKFGAFLASLVDEGVEFVATGHYARLSAKERYLLRGLDPLKDQSYFLSSVLPSAFQKACFPVGFLHKSKVKALAAAAGFHSVVTKPESQGVCFIGERGSQFSRFLEEYVENRPGRFIDAESGKDMGLHRGSLNYTIGQRARVAGKNQPYFVARKIGDDVVIAPGHNHPAVAADFVVARFESRLVEENSLDDHQDDRFSLDCQVRYRAAPSKCSLRMMTRPDDGVATYLRVSFERDEFGVAEGQTLALYDGERCLGGGEIVEVHRPFFDKV